MTKTIIFFLFICNFLNFPFSVGDCISKLSWAQVFYEKSRRIFQDLQYYKSYSSVTHTLLVKIMESRANPASPIPTYQ